MAIGRVARLAAGALPLILAPLTQPRIAWADGRQPDKMACIAADSDGQSLRMTGNLLRARKRFAVCSATTCPAIVRDDCLQRVAELEAAQPTVVFTATNGLGRVVVAVRVSVDDDVVADRLDGRPIRVDPGNHLFVFEALGRLTTQMRLTLHEGDKDVRHAVVLHTSAGDPADEVPAPEPIAPVNQVTSDAELPIAAPSPGAPAPVQALPPSTTPLKGKPLSKRQVAAIGAGAAGAVGVVLGSIFGAITIKEWSDAKVHCRVPPSAADGEHVCDPGGNGSGQSGYDESRTAIHDGNISTIAFAAGGVGLAVGAFLWFLPEPPSSRSGVGIAPAVGPSEGQLLVRGRF